MSLFVLTAGDELYDCLVQAVPMEFVGKQFLLSVLCIITMLLLDKPRLACKFGISKSLGTVFDEIRVSRETNGIVLPAQLDAITKFYKDVINSYLTYFGEIKGFHDFDASVDSLPGHGDSWERKDKGFSKFHEMLKSIAYLCAPDDWNVPMPVYNNRFDLRKSPGYCYLKLFTPASVSMISNLLGALPTLECLLSVLVPKVLISPDEMDKLKIFRVNSDHSWRIALDDEIPHGQVSHSIHDVISHDSSRLLGSRLDLRHTIRVTERIGSKLEDELQYSVFEKAMKILALSRSREAVAIEPIDDPSANENAIRDDLDSKIDCKIDLESESNVRFRNADNVVEPQQNDHEDRLDRLRRFAKDHRHLLDDLIRDKKDRVCEDLEPDLRFHYEGQILRERDKLPLDFNLLIHLWLRALNELKRDFAVLLSDTSDGLVDFEKGFEDYFNK